MTRRRFVVGRHFGERSGQKLKHRHSKPSFNCWSNFLNLLSVLLRKESHFARLGNRIAGASNATKNHGWIKTSSKSTSTDRFNTKARCFRICITQTIHKITCPAIASERRRKGAVGLAPARKPPSFEHQLKISFWAAHLAAAPKSGLQIRTMGLRSLKLTMRVRSSYEQQVQWGFQSP